MRTKTQLLALNGIIGGINGMNSANANTYYNY